MKNFTLLLCAFAFVIFGSTGAMAQEHNYQNEKAFLGMYFSHITPDRAAMHGLPQAYGGMATSIFEGSPADKAGLQKGDYVIAIDQNLTRADMNLQDVIRLYHPCDKVEVTFIRNGETMTTNATLVKLPSQDYFQHKAKGNDTFLGLYFSYDPNGANLTVTKAIEHSPAADMGLMANDELQTVNGKPVKYVADIKRALEGQGSGDKVRVTFLRNGKKKTASASLKTKAETYFHLECEEPEEVVALTDEELEELERNSQIVASPQKLGIGSVNFFPNPSNGEFDMIFSLYEEGDIDVRIFSSEGQVVYTEQVQGFSGNFSGHVDISDYAPGIYFLVVQQNDKSVTKKVVLQ